MFPSTIRARQRSRTIDAAKVYQRESPPDPSAGHMIGHPAGSTLPATEDGDFGVTSMSASDWGSQVFDTDAAALLAGSGTLDAGPQEQQQVSETEQEHTQERMGKGQTYNFAQKMKEASNGSASPAHHHGAADGQTRSDALLEPPSPEDTIHPLDQHSTPGHHWRLQDLPTMGPGVDTEAGTPTSPSILASELDSPMSFASIPSYIASLSSLSRTSSGMSALNDSDDQAGSRGDRQPRQERDKDVTGLVLPPCSLPSAILPLNLSSPRWLNRTSGKDDSQSYVVGSSGDACPVTLAVVGGHEHVERVLRELKDDESVEMIELDTASVDGGGVKIVKGGKLVVRLVTSLNMDQVNEKVTGSYQTLSDLLSPAPPLTNEMEKDLKRLVGNWAEKDRWLCGVVVLGGDDANRTNAIIPTITIPISTPPVSPEQDDAREFIPEPTPQQHLYEPTPRPTTSTDGYFSTQPYMSSDSSQVSSSGPEDGLASERLSKEAKTMLSLISTSFDLVERSVESFLAWRSIPPSISLAASASASASLSPSGSQSSAYGWTYGYNAYAYSSGPMMPTVARAQGGGEWEANLSRRVAIRRESSGAVIKPGSGSGGGTGMRWQSQSHGLGISNVKTHVGPAVKSKARRRRRSLERPIDKADCPLFPPHPNYSSGSELAKARRSFSEALERMFGSRGIKGLCAGLGMGRGNNDDEEKNRGKGWKWGMGMGMSVAVVVLVGVGFVGWEFLVKGRA